MMSSAYASRTNSFDTDPSAPSADLDLSFQSVRRKDRRTNPVTSVKKKGVIPEMNLFTNAQSPKGIISSMKYLPRFDTFLG